MIEFEGYNLRVCVLSCFDDLLLKDTGYSVRIYNLARGIAERKHEVHIVIPSVERCWCTCTDGVFVHGLSGFLPKNLLKIFARFLGVSKHTSILFYDFLFISRAAQIIRRCDSVQVEQPSVAVLFALLAKLLSKPLVVDCHDVLQALRVRHTGFVRRILEIFMELFVYRFGDVVLVVSEKERHILSFLSVFERKDVEVVPNGVDCEVFGISSSVDYSLKERYGLGDSFVVVFVGNLEYLPNQEAVRLIAYRIAPRVLKKLGNVKFLVVGRIPEGFDLRVSHNLVLTGSVESVVNVLGISDVAIAPLLQGSGTRLKVLEYFVCGLSVVSTSVGVEGLHVIDGVNALVEDDMDRFADQIVDLLRDRSKATRLGENARRMAVGEYDWKVIVKRLEEIHQRVVRLNS